MHDPNRPDHEPDDATPAPLPPGDHSAPSDDRAGESITGSAANDLSWADSEAPIRDTANSRVDDSLAAEPIETGAPPTRQVDEAALSDGGNSSAIADNRSELSAPQDAVTAPLAAADPSQSAGAAPWPFSQYGEAPQTGGEPQAAGDALAADDAVSSEGAVSSHDTVLSDDWTPWQDIDATMFAAQFDAAPPRAGSRSVDASAQASIAAAHAAAERALFEAQAAARRIAALEQGLRSQVEAMRSEMIVASAQWSVANQRW